MKIISIPKVDLKEIIKHFTRQLGFFIFLVLVLFFDSVYFSENIYNAQNILSFLMIVGFFIMYFRTTTRVKELMIYAVILGFMGEYLFSVYLEMYTYRLKNVPLYVPFGHAVLYARVFRFSKASIVKKHHKTLERFLTKIIVLFASVYLVLFSDVFGFLMTALVFLLLWKRPKDKLFFISMYILVAILEIGGTAFGCWYWPETAFGVFGFLPSNNPPSGISLFYFLLDVGCFLIYIMFHNKAWVRVKNIRKLKA